jgi:hypothetical protein
VALRVLTDVVTSAKLSWALRLFVFRQLPKRGSLLILWLVEFVRFATSASTQEYDTRTFSFGQKREAAFLPLLFHLSKLRYGILHLIEDRRPNLVAIPRFEESRMAWTKPSRPFKADTSFA